MWEPNHPHSAELEHKSGRIEQFSCLCGIARRGPSDLFFSLQRYLLPPNLEGGGRRGSKGGNTIKELKRGSEGAEAAVHH